MISKLPPLNVLLNLMPDALCVVDAEGRILFVSGSFERILGYGVEEVVGRRIFELVHPDDRAATMDQAQEVMTGALQRHFRNRYLHKQGRAVDIQWSARWLPEYGVRVGIAHEVTELRNAERELEFRASHDALTGLPNRHKLRQDLHQAIAHAVHTGEGLALLYIDLDGFKAINDRLGHDAGDRLLQEAARRLKQGVRFGDVVGRVGGDEFVVLLRGCADAEAGLTVVRNLRGCLNPTDAAPGDLFPLEASFGFAWFPTDGRDPDTLLVHADRAMYASKRSRRGDAQAE